MAKFENRHLYCGGSDFATILDINPWKKRIELVLEKAQVIANTFEGNEATRRGEKLESSVIDLFEKETGLLVTDRQKTYKIEPTETCMCLYGHIDGLTSDNCIFEAKTTDVISKSWKNGIPVYYEAQLEFYLFLSKLEKAYIAVAFCNEDNIVDFKYFEYSRKMTDEEIMEACENFTKEVEQYKDLGVINSGIIKDFKIDSKLIERYEELNENIKEIKKQLKPFEEEKSLIESQFKQAIGNDYGLQDDLYRITLSNRITSPSVGYKVSRSGLKIEYRK